MYTQIPTFTKYNLSKIQWYTVYGQAIFLLYIFLIFILYLKSNTENIDAVCVVTGGDSESSYYKTTAIQQWLFGVEISDTAILFLDKLVVFVASPKKIAFLKQIEGGKENDSSPKFKFINREKTDTSKSFLSEAIELLKKSHNVRENIYLLSDPIQLV
jgi:nucleosome binding factor SPN SPT16 subunit